MEILNSTQYVDPGKQKEPWYQLSVINQWDWKTKPVCYRMSDNIMISYCLYKYTSTSENSYKGDIVENLTDEMKEELISKNYIISKK